MRDVFDSSETIYNKQALEKTYGEYENIQLYKIKVYIFNGPVL